MSKRSYSPLHTNSQETGVICEILTHFIQGPLCLDRCLFVRWHSTQRDYRRRINCISFIRRCWEEKMRVVKEKLKRELSGASVLLYNQYLNDLVFFDKTTKVMEVLRNYINDHVDQNRIVSTGFVIDHKVVNVSSNDAHKINAFLNRLGWCACVIGQQIRISRILSIEKSTHTIAYYNRFNTLRCATTQSEQDKLFLDFSMYFNK